MKKLFPLLVLGTTLLTAPGNAQTTAPEGFTAGYIIAADGTKKEGLIKEQFSRKATFVFLPAGGKKQTLAGNEVNEVVTGGIHYISYANDFFKVISNGTKAGLLQKVSDATGKVIYNGGQATGISSGTEGRIGDFFIRMNGTPGLVLMTRETLNKQALTLLGDCPSIKEAATAGKLEITGLEAIVQQYNTCN